MQTNLFKAVMSADKDTLDDLSVPASADKFLKIVADELGISDQDVSKSLFAIGQCARDIMKDIQAGADLSSIPQHLGSHLPEITMAYKIKELGESTIGSLFPMVSGKTTGSPLGSLIAGLISSEETHDDVKGHLRDLLKEE